MELSVSKADLLRELQFFQGIVERKNTIPILANVLLDAKGTEVRLAATDLEVGLKSRCDAKVEKAGSLTLPAKKLFEIIKALPDTDVLIQEDKNGVKVAAERFESRLPTMSRDDFPAMPDGGGPDAGVASLPRDITRQMVAKTQFAITGEDTRYFLNGALLVLTPKDMSMVATDGHRLALVKAPREAAPGAPDELRVIVQKKTLLELGRLLGEAGDVVTFEKGENHLFFRFADRVLVSRMIDGQFPAYERVIPKGNDKAVEFDRDRLTNAVKRVALLANERSRSVKFQIDPGEVTVASNSSEFGEAKEVIPVEYSGPSVTICFNAQYVLDFLAVAETEIVVLQFKDEMSQAVMKPVGAIGYDYTYVIMPMRI
jgi:DNA polymerase III subunit beta